MQTINMYSEIEELTVEIFRNSGFIITKEPIDITNDVDIISADSTNTYYVEIKASTSI